jgi:hypothetical protein
MALARRVRPVMTPWFFRLAAFSAVLVPAVQIPALVWARETFLGLNPDYLADPPTISRAISDPRVGEPFGWLVALVTGLLCFAVPIILVSYWKTASRAKMANRRRLMIRLGIVLAGLSQAAALFGLNMLTVHRLGLSGELHMLGSYIFFAAQVLAIAIAANLCRSLLPGGVDGWLQPSMQRLRFPMGLAVIALTLAYLGLFIGKDHNTVFPQYAVQLVYVQCEVLVTSCFTLFLATYGVDLWALSKPRSQTRLSGPLPEQAISSRQIE